MKQTLSNFPNATFPVRKKFSNGSVMCNLPHTTNQNDAYSRIRLSMFQYFESDCQNWESNLEYLLPVLDNFVKNIELPKISDKFYYDYKVIAPYPLSLPWFRASETSSPIEVICIREQS